MVNPRLVSDVQARLEQGRTPEEIYLELLQRGHLVREIEEAFSAAAVREEEPETQKKTISIVLLIGAVLVGAGIFSFIAANWQEMTRALKLGIIVASMLAAYVAGWYLKERLSMVRTGNALILLGSIIFGAGIFLIGQIFNVRANWPDGFILWMLGIIPLAFALQLYSLFSLALVVGVVGLAGHPFGIFDAFSSYNRFLLTSSFLLLAAAVATLLTGLLVRKWLPRGGKDTGEQ